MGNDSKILRRGDHLYFRARVPAELVPLVGKREIKRSLKTTDRREARRRRNTIENELEAEWDAMRLNKLRNSDKLRVASLSLQEINSKISAHFATHAAKNFEELRSVSDTRREELLWEAAVLMNCYNDAEHVQTLQDAKTLESELFSSSDYLKRLDTVQRRYVEDKIRRGLLDQETRKHARLSGNYNSRSFDRDFMQTRRSAVTLERIAEEYLVEHSKISRAGEKRKKMLRACVDLILDFFGRSTSVALIDQQQCREFRDLLNELPSNMRKHFSDRLAPLSEISSEAQRRGLPKMKRNTQDKYISALQKVLKWAKDEKHISSNPAESIEARGEQTPPKLARNPFAIDDLNKIFRVGPYNPDTLDKSGHQFWVMLIALFSGMRTNEICQLDIDDIRQSASIWYFDVNDNAPDKRVKNGRSRRKVPIHSVLVGCGLLTYHRARKSSNSKRKLFDLRISKEGYYSDHFSRWGNEQLLPKAGVKSSTKVVHSFRHTVKDELEKHQIHYTVIDAIGGWNTVLRGASGNYGSGPSLGRCAAELEKLKFEGLDISHLLSQQTFGD